MMGMGMGRRRRKKMKEMRRGKLKMIELIMVIMSSRGGERFAGRDMCSLEKVAMGQRGKEKKRRRKEDEEKKKGR